MDRLAALQAVVRPGDCFWDIGAHKGFVTLAAASMVGPSGSVVSLEPSGRNLWFIRKHLSWNPAEHVRVLRGAGNFRRSIGPDCGAESADTQDRQPSPRQTP